MSALLTGLTRVPQVPRSPRPCQIWLYQADFKPLSGASKAGTCPVIVSAERRVMSSRLGHLSTGFGTARLSRIPEKEERQWLPRTTASRAPRVGRYTFCATLYSSIRELGMRPVGDTSRPWSSSHLRTSLVVNVPLFPLSA